MKLEELKQMFELQKEWEANESKKAYHEAMAMFKAEAPEITKDKTVGYETEKGGVVGYRHASLANVTNTINKALGEHGLSVGWTTSQEKDVTVTCTITHKMGHSESTSLTAAPDNSGKKNPIQSLGSTISYLERYTILALTGLATTDMDDDGQSSGPEPEYITEEQAIELGIIIEEKNIDLERLLEKLKIESLAHLHKEHFESSFRTLKNAAPRPKKPEREPGSDDE